ncbi:MAG TPA: anthranilate synthase component I family protein [Chitinophagaceae bacterium]|nr:anthranilate synthase component I family protein [Chitinophagaceae bacterium]
MDSNFISFPITDFKRTKQQVLSWVNQFSTCCFLDNHQYQFNHHTYECAAGAGATSFIELPAGTALEQLQQFQQKHEGWLFGHLGYDLKNEVEDLVSANPDHIRFPDLFFFSPQTVLLLNQNELCISAGNAEKAAQVFAAVSNTGIAQDQLSHANHIVFQQRFSKQDYIETIEKLRSHILRGDCYEINFCQEFFAEHVQIDPVFVYQLLSMVSPSPFAAFYKMNGKYLLCASPERYLKKEGDIIISQPIKGTGKRDLSDTAADEFNKERLYNSSKDRSENVMVVDLVRNDLSKICVEGTVYVEELFGIYSFPQVHQMISTIGGTLQPGLTFTDIIKKTFPMGSMTGAPKKKVMELIEKYETVKRGIFSGAVGYIKPGGDFDFNVVIRSVLYNQDSQYLSYLVGSGITFYSKAEEEYEECLLKAAAIKQVFR